MRGLTKVDRHMSRQQAADQRDRARRLLAALLTGVVVLGLAVPAIAGSTIDQRWFGWVTENGQSHRVCGDAYTWQDFGGSVFGTSYSYYKGFGTTNPNCNTSGDSVATGWLGAYTYLYKDGALCQSASLTYNPVTATIHGRTAGQCANPSGTQNFQTHAYHRWWAKDCGCYAGDNNWSPVLSA